MKSNLTTGSRPCGNIMVTGANGQLGKCFQKSAPEFSRFRFFFLTSQELDITSEEDLAWYFDKNRIDYCINCAAYTNVEKAESEEIMAFRVNAEAILNLAKICQKNETVLIHFSTDYVFDGNADDPYDEEDRTGPLNVYGASKLEGEKFIQEIMGRYFIFRTSWLYSEFGRNFFTAMLGKSKEKGAKLQITTDQKGTPTNANDLAKMVLRLIAEEKDKFGLYHYSNLGQATWYDFALAILKNADRLKNVDLTPSGHYPTIAKRPKYSVLSKYKITTELKVAIPFWEKSLYELEIIGSHGF